MINDLEPITADGFLVHFHVFEMAGMLTVIGFIES